MTASTKTQRLLDIVAYLVGRRLPVSVDELMAAVPAYAERWREGDDTERQSARRSFERDKDELRTLGIPLETVAYTVDGVTEPGYRITRRDFYLPYLKLLRGRAQGCRLTDKLVYEAAIPTLSHAPCLDPLSKVP